MRAVPNRASGVADPVQGVAPERVGRRRRGRILALAVTGALVVAACGGDDDDDAAAPDGSSPGTGASSGTTAAGTPATDPDAELRVDVTIDLTNLDPHRAQYPYDMTILEPMYDRLFDLSRTGEVVPMLVTEYEFDDAGTTLDLHLRDDVTFHDGTPFDAAAVKANIERGQTLEGSAVAVDLTGITAVEVVDESLVRLSLAEPDVSLLASLANRAGAMISPAAFDTDLSRQEAGAGPFTLAEYNPGAGLTYDRFEDYWDPAAAAVANLEIRVQADATSRLNALRSGQTDVSTVNPAQFEEASRIDGLVATASPGTTYNQVLLNRTRSEFDDIRVRQALYHAIDRQAICDAVLFGLCDLSVQPIVPGHWAYNPERPADYYDYDPDKSRELLAEAGLADGFSFELMTPASLAPYPEFAEILQAQLAEVGIEAKLMAVEPAQMGERMLVRQESDALLGGQPGTGDPSRIYAAGFLAESFANAGGHTTPRMEELYHESIVTFDQDERQQVLWDAAAEAVDSVLVIVIGIPNTITVASEDVVDFDTGSLRGYVSTRGVGIAA